MTTHQIQVSSKATSPRKFLNDIDNKDLMKRTDSYLIHINKINFVEEWNIRNIDSEQVLAIKTSISNGEEPEASTVEMVYIDDVPMFNIVDGHHTYCALRELHEEGKHDGTLKVVIFKGNEADKLVRAFNSTQGKPLTPIESANVFQRMKSNGLTNSKISERTGKSLSFISNALFLLNGDNEMLKLIEDGSLSSSRAGRLLRDHGADMATSVAKLEIGLSNDATVAAIPEEASAQADNKPQGEKVKTECSEGQRVRKAAKNAMKRKTLSAGKVTSALELIKTMSKRVNDDHMVELNEHLVAQLESLSSELERIESHNQSVMSHLAELSQ